MAYRYSVSGTSIMDAHMEETAFGATLAYSVAQHFKELGCKDVTIKRVHDGRVPTEAELLAETRDEDRQRFEDR